MVGVLHTIETVIILSGCPPGKLYLDGDGESS